MLRRSLYALCLLAGLAACKQTDETSTPTYDRQALLANQADHFIIPAYQALSVAADSQQAALQRLANEPSEATVAKARTAFRQAFMAGQAPIYFDFGPAELANGGMFWASINTFPTSQAKIDAAVAAGSLPTNDARSFDTRGFGALDYLLFADSATTAARFAANANLGRYALACATDIATKSRQMRESWAGYRIGFLASQGTSAGSSTSELFNAYVYGYELVKNQKVALPAGKMAGQAHTEPTRVEGLFSGLGRAALQANLTQLRLLYTGNASDGNGPGWEDYLNALPGGTDLTATTLKQLQSLETAAAALPNQPLSVTAQGPAPELETLFNQLQMTTRYLKADMSSLLGIAITFSSGDGD